MALTTAIEVVPHPGELVSIQSSGTVPVISGALALAVLPANFTRGGDGNVQFSLTNPSAKDVEIVVARNQGAAPSDQVRINLIDANGTLYGTTPVQFNLGANIITLSDGDTVLKIPAGTTVTSPIQLVAVPASVPDNLFAQLQIDNVYFDEGQADQVILTGLITRQAVSVMTTSYFATVTNITPAVSNGNQPIVISGTATYRSTNTPAANQAVELYLASGGYQLDYPLATDRNGNFSYTFTPISGQCAGVYSVWAVNPVVTDKTVQQTFAIQQITLNPTALNLSAPKNYPQTLNFTAQSGSGTTATGLHFDYLASDQPGGEFPTGINVDLSKAVITNLAANTSAAMPVTFTGDNTVSGAGSIVLRLRSDNDQGQPWQTVTVNYTFADAIASLLWDNYNYSTGVNPGGSVAVGLNLLNQGLAAASNVNLQLLNTDGTPAPSWVSLGNASNFTQLAVGSTTPVTVNINPPASQAEGDYAFLVRATGTNQGNQDAVISVAVTSSSTGSATFLAEDIYTGTKDSQGNTIPGLAGAIVTLQNDTVASVTVTMTTDNTGQATFTNLPAGHYQYQFTASGHDSTSGGLYIRPGATTAQQVMLQNDTVSVSWQVVPTTIQDQYDITLNATFQTDVPVAVITANPGLINLPTMQQGDVFNGEITFTNQGLIEANNVSYALPANDSYLQYQLLGQVPANLAPGQSVTVAYRITCLQPFPGTSLKTVMIGTGGAGFAVAFGLVAFDWPNRRRRLVHLGLRFVLGALSVTVVVTALRVQADSSNNSGCFHYENGSPIISTCKCQNGKIVPVSFTVYFSYIVNNCPGAPPPAPSTYQASNLVAGGHGGIRITPVAFGGGKGCIPKCEGCDTKENTRSSISLTQEEYRDSEQDLSVKVPGGSAVIDRDFYQNGWNWQNLTEKLQLQLGTSGIGTINFCQRYL